MLAQEKRNNHSFNTDLFTCKVYSNISNNKFVAANLFLQTQRNEKEIVDDSVCPTCPSERQLSSEELHRCSGQKMSDFGSTSS